MVNSVTEQANKTDAVTTFSLIEGKADQTYRVAKIDTDDLEMIDFLFTLGCYKDEQITIISMLSENVVLSIKDARYSIGWDLAKAIVVYEQKGD